MVAKNIRLPNIRRMLVPDPGYTIVDADLSGADAQVVAWEAKDDELKDAFRKGLKIHIHNCRAMRPDETKDMEDAEIKKSRFYDENKRGVHATNYGGSVNALVERIGWSKSFASEFQERWFHLHPGIREWHRRYDRYLAGTQCYNCDNLDIVLGRPCNCCGASLGRTVKNAFGFRRTYFERIDGQLLPAALAWTPQSTVNFCVELGWTAIASGPEFTFATSHNGVNTYDWSHLLVDFDYARWRPVMQFLLQVHDSIVFQVPHRYEDDIPAMVKSMQVRVPYSDELIIPMSFGKSRLSWGDCE